MAPWRAVVVVAIALCVAVFGEPVAPELVPTQWNGFFHPDPAAATAISHSLQDATTAQPARLSFFQKFLNAAKGLVSPMWAGSTNSTVTIETPATSVSSRSIVTDHLSTRTLVPVHVMQGGHSVTPAKMNFTLRILNDDFSVFAEPPTYMPGSPIRTEARVESSKNISPKIYVDTCYGTHAEYPSHSGRLYVIVNNHGCLHGGKSMNAAVWHRPEDSALRFVIPAFLLTDEPEEKIYIHCLLSAWGQDHLPSLGKKSCYYNSSALSWQNLEDPSQNTKCNCCDSHCPADSAPTGELREFVGEGMLHRRVAGPVMVHKEEAPWYEERCRTVKELLLASIAFAGSCVVGAAFVGGLLALAFVLSRRYWRGAGRRLVRKRKEYPYQTELQTVVSNLLPAEETPKKGESSADCNSNADAAKKEPATKQQ